MNLLDYLQQYFLSRAELVRAASIDDATLADLQARGAVPQPSYLLKMDIDCTSFFGRHAEHALQQYYAVGCVAWIAAISGASASPYQVFADRYRASLDALRADGIVSGDVKLNAGLGEYLKTEWAYFLDGTYGLCTRTGLPEQIAAKEVAVAIIKEMTENLAGRVLSPGERRRLARAVDLLDAASAPFAPHEVERSSRRRLVTDVRAAYLSGNC